MDEPHRLFLHPRKAAIARTLYHLCESRYHECYASKIHRQLPVATTMQTVLEAVQEFEDHGWVERTDPDGRIKPIQLTETGYTVFTTLVDFLEALDGETEG